MGRPHVVPHTLNCCTPVRSPQDLVLMMELPSISWTQRCTASSPLGEVRQRIACICSMGSCKRSHCRSTTVVYPKASSLAALCIEAHIATWWHAEQGIAVDPRRKRRSPRSFASAAFDTGKSVELRQDEAFDIPPIPHDSWAVGNEPYVSLHLVGADKYAR